MHSIFKKLIKLFAWLFLGLVGLILVFIVYYFFAVKFEEPQIDVQNLESYERIKHSDSSYSFNKSFLRKNTFGIWEMYLEGSAEEIGYSHGILAQELMTFQEEAFVTQIEKMIPDKKYLKFLKYVTSFMNRNLQDYIPIEYQKEIKAISLFADERFNFIGDNYARQLNYHAAHDIGHAMQNLNLVACTAFSVWDSLSADSSLLIGRNFDFYVGDEFAENKLILFVAPDTGYSFASYAWAGMSGIVSGMNDQGLSITLNAAKSDIPFSAKTPVSIIAREIIQYAANIEEAYTIAKKRPSFVAETFFIGSAKDHQTAIIEKTPDTTILLKAESEAKQILTNHFQSPTLFFEKLNLDNLKENATGLRFERVEELLNSKSVNGIVDFVSILRNPLGINNESIGLGNELAVNQFIAHHSILFKPEEKKLWISTKPFQLGAFVPYSLEDIFQNPKVLINENYNVINPDSVQLNTLYISYLDYNYQKGLIENAIKTNSLIESEILEYFISSNPNYFYTWELIGDYQMHFGENEKAKHAYKKSLLYVIPNQYEKKRIEEKIRIIDK